MRNDLATEASRRKFELAETALRAQAMTTIQLRAAIHVSAPHIFRYVRALRGDQPGHTRRIYIERWVKGEGVRARHIAAYRWMETGLEKDAPQPKPMTAKEREVKRTKRVATDPVLNARVNALRRIRYNTKAGRLISVLPAGFFGRQPCA